MRAAVFKMSFDEGWPFAGFRWCVRNYASPTLYNNIPMLFGLHGLFLSVTSVCLLVGALLSSSAYYYGSDDEARSESE